MGKRSISIIACGLLACVFVQSVARAAPDAAFASYAFDQSYAARPTQFAIPVPGDDWSRPGAIYVLPVFVVASDRGQYAENPSTPGYGFDGQPMSDANLANFKRATANMSAQLQMARRMYYRMLRNPLNGDARGTFNLARWNPWVRGTQSVTDYDAEVTPLVVSVPDSASSIKSQLQTELYSFVDDVMDRLGCHQVSCPFALMMVIVQDAGIGTGGRKLNQGFDNGGGIAVFDWEDVRDSNFGNAECLRMPRLSDDEPPADLWVPIGCRHFQSTLVHEIGHALGLNHSWEYGGSGAYYGQSSSASIMSYNPDNWIPGCGVGNEAPDSATPCAYPSLDETIDDNPGTWPGALLADDLRVLARHRRAFPVLDYARALDTPTGIEPVLHQFYSGTTEIPGQPRLYITQSLTAEGSPDALVGGYSEAILQAWEPWDSKRGYTAGPFGPGLTSAMQLIFPGPVRLTRVRFYAAHGGLEHVPGVFYNTPREARVGCSGCLDGGYDILGSASFDQDLNRTVTLLPHATTDQYQIELQHDTQYATLRGMRLWGEIDGIGPEVELFPAAEPVVSTDFATYDGDLATITGSDQVVRPFQDSWSPADSWHSEAVSCGDWVSVTVEFPDDVELGYVKAHTGHSGIYHVPDLVQVERECVCRAVNTGEGGICDRTASEASCAAAGGPGNRVFEFVDREFADADHLVGFTATGAHRWKIAMHTPDGPGQCYVSVRGLRFFSAEGYELFPARSRPDGE